MKTYSIHIEFLDYETQEEGAFGFGGITSPLDVVLEQVTRNVINIEKDVGEVVKILIEFEYEIEGG